MKRRIGVFLIIGAAVSLVAVSTAWACGVLATVSLSSSTAAPGSTLAVTGEHYSSSATFGPVAIRLNSRTATPLATTTPDAAGRIGVTTPLNVTIPSGTSQGWYVVLATQNNTSNGTPKSGTPGRTSLRVQGASAASRKRHSGVAAAPWGSSKPTGGAGASLVAHTGSSTSTPVLPTLLGIVLSLGLLGTGLTLVVRGRAANRVQLGA